MASNRHHSAHPQGGLTLPADDSSCSVIKQILKSLSRKILEGNFSDLMRISRPASISYPKTFLQAAIQDFSYCSFLTQAALVDDPLIRLQLVCAFIISGLHINPVQFGNTPPLNPILGETYSACMRDGTQIWLEQTSHHPPVTHWYLEGPQSLYQFFGYGQIRAGLSGPNTIKASKLGKHTIIFKNGEKVEYDAPDMRINGIVFGQRTVNFEGKFGVVDSKNGLKAVISFEDHAGIVGSIKGKVSGLWKKTKKVPSDCFRVKIIKNDEVVCEGNGSWLEFVDIGRMWWNIQRQPVDEWVEMKSCLPSDSVCRGDLQNLLSGDVDSAQIEKDRLENQQRADAVLRESYRKKKIGLYNYL